MAEIDLLLYRAKQLEASDLHLKPGLRPRYRTDGVLKEIEDGAVLSSDDIERLLHEILTRDQIIRCRVTKELDFSYGDPKSGRFRCNFFREHRGAAAVFRRIPIDVPSFRSLNLPRDVESFAHARRGLVLVTGSSGSGKSSTLASLVDIINTTYNRHIITLEDPIEYVHQSRNSVVHQRGLGYDLEDFSSGIVSALRQDPDVLLIGELREVDSIRQALTAAETGLLVFATLHTNGAAEAIDRVVDVFPPAEQLQIRSMMSQSLLGVLSQCLIPRRDGNGRVPATEILKVTPAIGNLIRENKISEILNQMQSGKEEGMRLLDESLERLVQTGAITRESASVHARNKTRFESPARLSRV